MKKLLPWLILGLILRILLIPVTAHPDLRGFPLAAQLISQKNHPLDFYDYISRLPRDNPLVILYRDDLFIYPPLAYLTPAMYMSVLSPFYTWSFFDQFILDMGKVVNDPQVISFLYLTKGPYIVADILILLVIMKVVPPQSKILTGIVWWLNPVNLYTTYIIGQFDIYLALFSLFSFWSLVKGKFSLSAFFLGVAAGYKPFPLFLLPFIPGNKAKNVAIGLVTYIVILAPYLSSPAFKQYALLASQTDKLFFAHISITGAHFLSLFLVGFGFLLWLNYFKYKAFPNWAWFAFPPLLFYAVSRFHPQWFLWSAPFLTIAYVLHSPSRRVIISLVIFYFAMIMTFDPSLNFDILRIDFSLLDTLAKVNLADTFISFLHSFFAATVLWLIYSWKETKTENS